MGFFTMYCPYLLSAIATPASSCRYLPRNASALLPAMRPELVAKADASPDEPLMG